MSEMKEIFKSDKLKLSVSKFAHFTEPQSQEVINVEKYTWETLNNLTLEVITLDAAIIGLRIPDRAYNPKEVLLVSGSVEEYLHYDEQGLTSSVQSKVFRKLHKTLSERIWEPYINGSDLILTNMVQFEGQNIMLRVKFSVMFNNLVRICYQVATDGAHTLEITHRLVMNLGGKMTGYLSTYDHVVQINGGEGFYRVHKNRLKDYNLQEMTDDLADLRVAQHLGMAIYRSDKSGFDGIYKLLKCKENKFDARIIHSTTGRVIEIYSDFQWIRLSTMNNLQDPNKTILPFYPSLGVKDIKQIFDLDGVIRSVVRVIENSDEDISHSSLAESLYSSSTMKNSIMRALIDELLMDMLEATREIKMKNDILTTEIRNIIEQIFLTSLDKMDKIIPNSVMARSQSPEDDLLSSNTNTTHSKTSSKSLINQELFSGTDSETTTEADVKITKEILDYPKYQKHAGILLQLSMSPSLKKCKPKGVFSHPNHATKQGLVFNRCVILKFGICKTSPSIASERVNKSDSNI